MICFYNTLKKQYNARCELIYSDADSLLLEIQNNDVYKDLEDRKYLYDTSDYPNDHLLYSNTQKNVLGKMKDKTAGVPITECVCLRLKMYSIQAEKQNIKKSKGKKKYVLQKEIGPRITKRRFSAK